MNNRIEPSPTFKREAKRLNKRYASFAADYEKLLENLSANPAERVKNRNCQVFEQVLVRLTGLEPARFPTGT